jgi:hypothetical protein
MPLLLSISQYIEPAVLLGEGEEEVENPDEADARDQPLVLPEYPN